MHFYQGGITSFPPAGTCLHVSLLDSLLKMTMPQSLSYSSHSFLLRGFNNFGHLFFTMQALPSFHVCEDNSKSKYDVISYQGLSYFLLPSYSCI